MDRLFSVSSRECLISPGAARVVLAQVVLARVLLARVSAFVPLVIGLAALGLTLSGCGGGETAAPAPSQSAAPSESSGDGPATSDGFAVPETAMDAAPSDASGSSTSGSSTRGGGMTLPDDVPLPTGDAIPEDKSAPKGMTLPDGVAPTSMLPRDRSTATVLVATTTEGDAANDPDSVDGKITVEFAKWAEVAAAAAKPGKVTVVDLWSLACIPCLKEFPNLVALQAKFAGEVRAISANLDYDGRKKYPPQSYEARATAFLTAVKADFNHYIVETPNEDVFTEVGIASIPAVLVFDRNGKLAGKFADVGETAGFNYENDIIPLVKKLIAK